RRGAVPARPPADPGVHRPAVLQAEVRRRADPGGLQRPAPRRGRPGVAHRRPAGRGPGHGTARPGLAVAAAGGADPVRERSVAVLALCTFGAFVALTTASVVLSAATPGQGDRPFELVSVLVAFLGIGAVGLLIVVRKGGN